MTRGARTRVAPPPRALAQKLAMAAREVGIDDITVPLTAAATAVLLLGTEDTLARQFLTHLAKAEPARARADLLTVWDAEVQAMPYLSPATTPLLEWTGHDPDWCRTDAFSRCAAVLADVDLRAVIEHPMVDGDLLGPLYTHLRSPAGIAASGAYYTPAPIGQLMAMLTLPKEGATIHEPACGAGGILVATVRAMRTAGRDPRTCLFHVNDIDPIAVALATVNLAAHGIPFVDPHVSDALTGT